VTAESEFQTQVTDLCRWLGLLWFHDNDSRRNEAGLPDLIIVGQHGLLFRELKTAKGRVTPEQADWLSRLKQAGADADVWRPADLVPAGGRIKSELVALVRPKKEQL
jgi:hypothetical protein